MRALRLAWLIFAVLALALVLHPLFVRSAHAQPGADCPTYAKYAAHFAYLRDLGARLELVTKEIARSTLELGQTHEQLQAEARRVFKDRRSRGDAAQNAYDRCIAVLGHFGKES